MKKDWKIGTKYCEHSEIAEACCLMRCVFNQFNNNALEYETKIENERKRDKVRGRKRHGMMKKKVSRPNDNGSIERNRKKAKRFK